MACPMLSCCVSAKKAVSCGKLLFCMLFLHALLAYCFRMPFSHAFFAIGGKVARMFFGRKIVAILSPCDTMVGNDFT